MKDNLKKLNNNGFRFLKPVASTQTADWTLFQKKLQLFRTVLLMQSEACQDQEMALEFENYFIELFSVLLSLLEEPEFVAESVATGKNSLHPALAILKVILSICECINYHLMSLDPPQAQRLAVLGCANKLTMITCLYLLACENTSVLKQDLVVNKLVSKREKQLKLSFVVELLSKVEKAKQESDPSQVKALESLKTRLTVTS